MLYLHIFILLTLGLLSACSVFDKLDMAENGVTNGERTADVVVGKYGRLGLRDFRSIAATMPGPTRYNDKLLPRSQELTAFSATVQVGIYKEANRRCTNLIVNSAQYECREIIENGGKDNHPDCVKAKAINIARANTFPDLEFSGNIKDALSPVMRHKIAMTLIDSFWDKVAFAPPEREQSIATVVAFLDAVVDPLLEKHTAYHDELKKEGIHTEAEIETKMQQWEEVQASTTGYKGKLLGLGVAEDVLNQACTAVLASAPIVFY